LYHVLGTTVLLLVEAWTVDASGDWKIDKVFGTQEPLNADKSASDWMVRVDDVLLSHFWPFH